MDKTRPSLITRIIGNPRPAWATALASLLLLSLPMLAALLDGEWNSFFSSGAWRPLMLPPAVIIYFLVVSPIMARSDAEMLKSFRPVVLLDDESFDRFLKTAAPINPINEWVAFGVGASFGIWMGLAWTQGSGVSWVGFYSPIALAAMFGLLAWTIYATIAATGLNAALHRQPLQIDIFDTRPFEPVGRQSLVVALVFFGGIVLSMFFGLSRENIHAWQTWLFYIPLAFVPLLVFFLGMRHTHRLLSAEKKRLREAAEAQTRRASREMSQRLAEGQSVTEKAAEFNALATYEERLRAIKTWPYDTPMLRWIFFAILTPLIVRAISLLLFGN